jgi:hypothetical protein
MAEERFRVRVRVENVEALRTLPLTEMRTACMGGFRTQQDGSVLFDALVSESVLRKVKDRRATVDVLADMADESKKKQAQVARGNPFEGDEWIPRGRGLKVRDEDAR